MFTKEVASRVSKDDVTWMTKGREMERKISHGTEELTHNRDRGSSVSVRVRSMCRQHRQGVVEHWEGAAGVEGEW